MFAELAVSKSWRLKVIAISGCVYSSDRTRPTDQDIRIMYTLRIRINRIGPIKEEETENIKTGSDPGGVLMCKVLRVYVICISWSVGPVRRIYTPRSQRSWATAISVQYRSRTLESSSKTTIIDLKGGFN